MLYIKIMKDKDTVIKMRIDSELHEQVRRNSIEDGRSIVEQYRYMVREYLKKDKR